MRFDAILKLYLLSWIREGENKIETSQMIRDALLMVTKQCLSPLVRILLRYGMSYGDFVELSKNVYVETARSYFALPGKKPTVSRISTITGLSRKEVTRLLNTQELSTASKRTGYNRALRVLNGWMTDPLFTDTNNKPKELEFEKGENSFTKLVKKFSGDITAKTIADELTRIDAIQVTPEGRLQLTKHAYIPDNDITEKLTILGDDVARLIETIDNNLVNTQADKKLFQRKVFYNHIPEEYLAEIKNYIDIKAQQCLEEINQHIAQFDRDNNPNLRGTGKHCCGLGIYHFQDH